MNLIENSLEKLLHYIEAENYNGYDPYDFLNGGLPLGWLGKYGQAIVIQAGKRIPINIRPMLGIRKEYNAKGMGLILQAYSIMYQKRKEEEDGSRQLEDGRRKSEVRSQKSVVRSQKSEVLLEKMQFIFNWLRDNYSKGYSGYCWGYNFPWASPGKYLKPGVPSAVVTAFVGKGIYEYYMATNDPKAIAVLKSASDFILNDLDITEDETGICFSYTPVIKDCCYNASLLGAELLAKTAAVTGDFLHKDKIIRAVDFVISRQQPDGSWNYSLDFKSGKERKQIDFHQGFVLESIFEIQKIIDPENKSYDESIKKGLDYYKNIQFDNEGCSNWRIPEKWPLEIHNQSQGIITFCRLSGYNDSYLAFAEKISEYTIRLMQSAEGYFYYRKYPGYVIKIPYMRWSQAWMMLALVVLLNHKKR